MKLQLACRDKWMSYFSAALRIVVQQTGVCKIMSKFDVALIIIYLVQQLDKTRYVLKQINP